MREKPPTRIVLLLLFVSSVATNRVSISGQRFDFVATKRAFSEPLSNNELFHYNIPQYLVLTQTSQSKQCR
jgi:hypothetical protein